MKHGFRDENIEVFLANGEKSEMSGKKKSDASDQNKYNKDNGGMDDVEGKCDLYRDGLYTALLFKI
jgi:hypothetical protein